MRFGLAVRGGLGLLTTIGACGDGGEPRERAQLDAGTSRDAAPSVDARPALPDATGPRDAQSATDAARARDAQSPADAQSIPPVCISTPDYDEDGIEWSAEVDAGLDPCRADSDGDTCGDASELYLGGCDPRSTVFSQCSFYLEVEDGRVRFTAPARSSPWPQLRLVGDAQLTLTAQPDGSSGGTAQGDHFSNVPAGSLLIFTVSSSTLAPGQPLPVRLVDDKSVELDRGTVVYIPMSCPLII